MAEIFRKIDTCFSNPARPVIPGSLNLHRANAIAERFRTSALRSCGLPQAGVLYELRKRHEQTEKSGGTRKLTPADLQRQMDEKRRRTRNGSHKNKKNPVKKRNPYKNT